MSFRMVKTALASCLFILLLLHQRSQVHATSYGSKRALQPSETECLCDAPPPFEESVGFTNSVLRVRVKSLQKKRRKNRKTYVAKVREVFKGSVDFKRIKITVDADKDSCGYFPLRTNTDFLIFQDDVSDNRFTIGRCFWNSKWKSVSEDHKKFLKELDVPSETAQSSTFVRTPSQDPLPATLRLADETVTKGYTNCSELEEDLEQALRFYASNFILSFKDSEGGFGGGGGLELFAPGEAEEDFDESTEDGGDEGEEEITEDSFGTNNQVEGVDEADIVRSDGTYVYLAYGDTLVVWNATSGEEVARAVMPQPENMAQEECEKPFRESFLPPGDCVHGYDAYATINGILLEGDRLVLIVSGYTFFYYPYIWEGDLAGFGGERGVSVLSDYGSSSVRVYNVSALGEEGTLELLGTKELTGVYNEGRSIGAKAHIATSTTVNTYAHLDKFLNRWHDRYADMNFTEYKEEATVVAEEIIPLLASRIVAELDDDGECGGITKLAAFVTPDFAKDLDGDGEVTSEESRRVLQDALSFRSIVIVTSFDMDEDFGVLAVAENRTVPEIPTESGAAFFGQYGPSIITASQNRMIFTANGYQWDEATWSSSSWTYILVFTLPSEVEAGAAEASGFGVVEGFPINKFAIDEHEGHLRIGTTQWARWGCVEFRIEKEFGYRYCHKWRQISDVENQVIILKYPDLEKNETIMEETGRVGDLGKPGESLFALRFQGDKAFAVTFERIDPFYTLDLSDPENPFAAGELEITGFSTYLHLIEDDQFVLSVGQEADDDGRILGVAVSLFNVTNFTAPTLAARYVVEDDPSLWSFSSASFDFKAFRYLEQSGVLLLPLTTHGRRKNDFTDGFLVIRVRTSKPKISFKFFIDHAQLQKKKRCYSRTYLPSRSLVFKGKATTLKGHAVMSTDLNTNGTLWVLDLDKDRDEEECFGWF